MTRTLLRAAGWLLLLGVIITAGAHTVLYVNRWQWARASLVGVAFVAALVIGSTVLVLSRLDRLERRVAAAERAAAGPAVPSPPPTAPDLGAAEPVPDFRWLAPKEQSYTYVFIPVLLAAGIVVSVLAAAVEHVAVAVQRRTAADGAVRVERIRKPWWTYVVFVAGLAVVTTLASLGLYQVTHHWGQPQQAGSTQLTVRVSVNDRRPQTGPMVEALGRYCALNSGAGADYESVEATSRFTAVLQVSPSLDEPAQRRFVGCLEDSLLDRTQMHVVAVRTVPAKI